MYECLQYDVSYDFGSSEYLIFTAICHVVDLCIYLEDAEESMSGCSVNAVYFYLGYLINYNDCHL